MTPRLKSLAGYVANLLRIRDELWNAADPELRAELDAAAFRKELRAAKEGERPRDIMATVAKRTAPTRKAALAAPPGLTPAEVSAIQRVGAGFVASLARPGRNVTGFLLFEIRVLVLEPGCDRADGSTRLQRDLTLTPTWGGQRRRRPNRSPAR